MIIASTHDFRDAARRRLPRFLFDYIDGGSYDEATLRRNHRDLASVALRQRVLAADVSAIDLRTDLFGRVQSLPVILGPVGLSGLYARRGEVQAVRAADAADIPFCLSTVSVCPLDEVRAAARAPLWFQLYVMKDRGFLRDLLVQAKQAGVGALVFTVDMPVPRARYRDLHSGMSGPFAAARRLAQAIGHPRWAWDVGLRGGPHNLGNVAPLLAKGSGLEDFIGWMAANFDASIGWSDIEAIRAHWDGPLIIKGILDPQDARSAVAAGVDGIVVSNHGGRQLDGVVSTASALPAIVQAVGDRATILADGGVRTGLDVVRMLALGAKGVLLGRAWAYALAAGGQGGVASLLDMIEREMRVALALTGVTRARDLGASNLSP
jgi:L-lactate dehydrogenase (cytochrome)